jgi:hypothetical protein
VAALKARPALRAIRNQLRGRRDPRRVQWEFDRRRPWVTGFNIDGRAYGGNHFFEGEYRVAQFEAAFADVRRILELGSLEGGMSFQMAAHPGRQVLAVEGRVQNVTKARYVQSLLGMTNVEFRQLNLEETPISSLGDFDAVMCSGVLYHLPRPCLLLDELGHCNSDCYVWTHFAFESEVEAEVDGAPGRWYREYGAADPLSGMSARSFWMTEVAIVARLKAAGFGDVEVIWRDLTGYPSGPALSLVARRQPASTPG